MKKLISGFTIVMALVFLAWFGVAQAEDITFEWDANTEPDLVGYNLYQSNTPDGQILGTSSPDFVQSIPAGTETVTITVNPVEDCTLYWVLTAYDPDYESGKSNEVSEYFNKAAPGAPVFRKTNVQAANVYVNGEVHVAEVSVETLRIIREVTGEGD